MVIAEELVLLIEKAQNGDQEVFEKLVNDNMLLVYKLAHRYKSKYVEFDDLISTGTIGLMKAIKQFDTSFNVEFSTYAVPLILGEIRKYFRDDGIVKISRGTKDLAKRIEDVRMEIEMTEHREARLEEIASRLEVGVEDIIVALDANNYPLSLDAPLDEDNMTLKDVIASEDSEFDDLSKIDLENAIKKLDKKDQLFIKLRFFDEMKQTDLAIRFSCSQVQISRREKRILEKLKELMS
ncbi:MAG: sigma-70 family RNA polymerase sigma factor [Erysipelotrichales bacterium]|nr:sigma-70 family RNA polymerase sigma factor [Erysipelotrichales bacterium]